MNVADLIFYLKSVDPSLPVVMAVYACGETSHQPVSEVLFSVEDGSLVLDAEFY